MKSRLRFAVISVASFLTVLVVLIGLLIGVGGVLSRRTVHADVEEMFAAGLSGEPILITKSELDGLPEPVRKWLARSGVSVGTPIPETVRLKQEGTFRQGEDSGWMPFTAEEYYTTNPPAFVWRARFKIAGVPLIEVVDSSLEGRGRTLVKLASVIEIGNASGPEMDQGAMLRYLNETMWFPSAALSEYISWEAVDSNSARATLDYDGLSVSAVFYFDDDGNLINMTAERYRTVGDDYYLDQWSTPLTEQGEVNGRLIPTSGTGVWSLNSGDFDYINLEVTDIEYDVASPY